MKKKQGDPGLSDSITSGLNGVVHLAEEAVLPPYMRCGESKHGFPGKVCEMQDFEPCLP